MEQKISFTGQPSDTKRFYASPQLVCHGSVRDLTQGGASGALETDGQPGNCKGNPGYKCSESRVKENIVRIGDHPLGFGLYLFDYRSEYRDLWGHGRQLGVMIDEVEPILPEAVSLHADGFKRVDYTLLGIERSIH